MRRGGGATVVAEKEVRVGERWYVSCFQRSTQGAGPAFVRLTERRLGHDVVKRKMERWRFANSP